MAIAPSMTSYITANFITADSLEENVRIEASIAGVREHNFGDDAKPDVKPTIDLDDGRRVQLNQTRLRVCIAAWGPNPKTGRQDGHHLSREDDVRGQARGVRRG